MTGKLHFENLRPINDADLSIYEEALDHALEDNGNKNIALSGSYSSGKSSLLESYKKKGGKKYKFLHISLAQYEPDKSGSSDQVNDNNVVSEKVLEGKILNQLLHQIKAKKIPQTIFKVKKKKSNWGIIFYSLGIVAAISLILYIFNFSNWNKFYLENFENNKFIVLLHFSTKISTWIIAIVLMFLLLVYLLFLIGKAQINRNMIKTISIKGNEIEIFNESKDSYFDKYLNDVIYLFENADADIIVFEDIDRFNDYKIFEQLKEINTLVNARNYKKRPRWLDNKIYIKFSNHKVMEWIKESRIVKTVTEKLSKKRKILFLYLLRDDMFVSKDRTKFFDMIIPVIPVIDGSNSYEKFIDILNKGQIVDQFDLKFIRKLFLYVDDMRLLKNIYNEFVIYQKKLNLIKLDSNKLLALIIYKNVFPRDFSDLQVSKGFIYSLLKNKGAYIQNKIEILNERVTNINDRLEQSKNEYLKSSDELDVLYVDTNDHLNINGSIRSPVQYNSIIEYTNAKKSPENYYSNQIQERLSNNQEYKDRKQSIEDKLEKNQVKLIQEKETVKKEIESVYSKKIKDVITRNDIITFKKSNILEETDEYKNIKKNDYFNLVVFLILNGYIDETYSDYMTHFYENSLSLNDKLFLRSIYDETVEPKELSLQNYSQVLEGMEDYDFYKTQAWNYSLLMFMLNQGNKYDDQIKRSIQSFNEHDELDFPVVLYKQYLSKELRVVLIVYIFNNWPGFIKKLEKEDEHKQLDSILEVALATIDYENVISKQNSENEIKNYLDNSISFLLNLERYSINLVDSLEKLSIKFNVIDYKKIDEDLFEKLYENSLYEINFVNLYSIYSKYCTSPDEIKFKHMNYAAIEENELTHLLTYISKNINEYIVKYLDFSDGQIKEPENVIYEILNNEELEFSNKQKYCESINTTINNLSSIREKELWPILIKKQIVLPTPDNIVTYYHFKDNEWTEELTSLVNSSDLAINIDLIDIKSKYGLINIFSNTIKCVELNDEKYLELLSAMKNSDDSEDLEGINDFSIENLPDNKMKILMNEKIIEMSKNCLLSIRKNYSHLSESFACLNIEEYLKLITDDSYYDESELLSILNKRDNFSHEIQIQIINSIRSPISIVESNFSENVKQYILENKFCIEDLPMLIQEYEIQTKKIQLTIYDLIITNIDKVFEKEIDINSEKLLTKISKSNELDLTLKQEIFSKNLLNLSKSKLKKLMIHLFISEKLINLLDSKEGNSQIEKTDINMRVLEYYKKRNWIKSFEIEDEFIKIS
ncbi:hypothetical protein [Carnobacterium maltaromaticum]|uniref:YobI family P-loop NTPase n=1 Tax=Carnobacterium maltaromaticum TaxID=2751 RepID=UPI00295EB2CC|nr:hypothetical protein [Carnobacterium maltaromaticum]